MNLIPDPGEPLSREVIEQVEIQLKYEGYIKKEEVKVERLKRMEAKKIPADLDYSAIDGLATEAVRSWRRFGLKLWRRHRGSVGSIQLTWRF